MINSLPIEKRDPGAPMITSEIRRMSFTKSLLDTGEEKTFPIYLDDQEKTKPLTTLLCKEKDFIINKEGKRTFVILKQALIEAPILQSPNCDLLFEIMCDASDYAVGAVLGQRLEKKSTAICYASKIIVKAQITYTTTEML